jgi:hypothetical protein
MIIKKANRKSETENKTYNKGENMAIALINDLTLGKHNKNNEIAVIQKVISK